MSAGNGPPTRESRPPTRPAIPKRSDRAGADGLSVQAPPDGNRPAQLRRRRECANELPALSWCPHGHSDPVECLTEQPAGPPAPWCCTTFTVAELAWLAAQGLGCGGGRCARRDVAA